MAFYVWVPMCIWRGSEELFHSFFSSTRFSRRSWSKLWKKLTYRSSKVGAYLWKWFLLVRLFLGGGHCSKYQKEKQFKVTGGGKLALAHSFRTIVCGWQTALLGSVVRQKNTVERHNREELPTSERPAKGEASDGARDKISSLIDFPSSWTPTS